jgi:alcohol dehydrogenase (cytochrome c)
VTAPAPKFMLGGNDKTYLYHNSTLALNPATGETVWYYQHAVDHWDLDHPYERILLDAVVAPSADEVPWINPRLQAGEQRRVVTGIPGKTGLVYTLDRATGEFLWARPTITQNVIEAIDGATGAVTISPEALFTGADQTVFVCPSSNGGKNWPAGAYSPKTGSMYFPMANTCMNSASIAAEATPEMTYAIDNETVVTPGTTNVGTIQAISAATGKLAWRHDQRAGVMGLVATAGDLIFVGDVAGRLHALDATTGKPLWETDLGSPVSGHPVSFAVNGKQYIAVSTGRANLTGSLARLTPETRASGTDNKLVVLALPD